MSGTVGAVIFDWGGTLTPWHDVDLIEQWHVFARAVHAEEDRARELALELQRAEGDAWARSRESHSSAALDGILADAGLGGVEHEAARAAYTKFWEPHTFTDPHVEQLWTALRDSDIRVGVLSNTIWSREHHRAIFERDGVAHLIDGDVYSSEITWTKPHPEAFRAAAAAVGVDPERCVYVGDRLFEDVYGPQQVGMRAIWIPHSDIPVGQRVEVDAQPDGTAHELMDVLRIVQGWAAPTITR